MGFENKTGLKVSNHYGPRVVGGTEGSLTTTDNKRTYAFDGTAPNLLTAVHTLPKGATGRVLSVEGATPTTLTFAGTDVKAAEYATPVAFDATSDQAINFVGTGKTLVSVEFDMA